MAARKVRIAGAEYVNIYQLSSVPYSPAHTLHLTAECEFEITADTY